MKGKAIIPLVLGLGLGLVAVKLGLDTIKKSQAAVGQHATLTAFRALRDIDSYVELRPEMFEAIETTANVFLPDTERIKSADELKQRVTCKPIAQGAPILVSMLAPRGTPAGVAGAIKPGYRAYSVEIDEATGVAYQMQPGDWVDVIVVMEVPSRSGARRSDTIAEVLLQRVQVLAVGRAALGGEPEATSKTRAPKAAKTVTLLVPQADVQKLHLAAQKGKISLAMRGDEDLDTGTLPNPARINEMLQSLRDEASAGGALLPGKAASPGGGALPAWFRLLGFRQGAAAPAEPQASPPESRPEVEPPYEMVVYRGLARAGAEVTVERILFENARSRRVVSAEKNRGSGGASRAAGHSSSSATTPVSPTEETQAGVSSGPSATPDVFTSNGPDTAPEESEE
ncbi:MAG TPA: Flp pilus assembly protein CpaB [Phycisphaerae bacterium]|nr:Flp pilus assembly protein CpaB [Phycisphaerae bacterium]HNU43771.1 Flp pilus assembly protein CpaB [Phycisphaerae bacterium]